MQGVPVANILNYDETNFADDPGAELVVTRRGSRHADSIKNITRTATSVMFCCSAEAKRTHNAWKENEPLVSNKYSATDSGWFKMDTFEEWFVQICCLYVKILVGPKLLIGDNLASHLSPRVV